MKNKSCAASPTSACLVFRGTVNFTESEDRRKPTHDTRKRRGGTSSCTHMKDKYSLESVELTPTRRFHSLSFSPLSPLPPLLSNAPARVGVRTTKQWYVFFPQKSPLDAVWTHLAVLIWATSCASLEHGKLLEWVDQIVDLMKRDATMCPKIIKLPATLSKLCSTGRSLRLSLCYPFPQANTLRPYLNAIRGTLDAALCLRNFPSQTVERHNKPEVETRYTNTHVCMVSWCKQTAVQILDVL